MKSDKIMLIAGGIGAGLIVGVILGIKLFAPSPAGAPASSAPAPVSPGAPAAGPDRIKLQATVRQLEEIVRNDPKNLQALVQLGNAYFDAEMPRPSIETYRKALALNDKDPNVWTDMGIMYRAVGDYSASIESFRKAMAISPMHPESRMNLGVVYYYDLKNTPAAVQAWEEFLRLEPSGPRADQVRGQIAQVKASAGAGGTDLDRAAQELQKSLNQPAAK